MLVSAKPEFARWLPFMTLMVLALLYEPVRSGFTFANQNCEWMTDWKRIQSSFFNLKHIISYTVLFLVLARTLRKNQVLIAALAVFLFSAFLEIEQSFFSTGHCRARDLIPNLLGIGLAAAIFLAGNSWRGRSEHSRK